MLEMLCEPGRKALSSFVRGRTYLLERFCHFGFDRLGFSVAGHRRQLSKLFCRCECHWVAITVSITRLRRFGYRKKIVCVIGLQRLGSAKNVECDTE